MALIDFDPLKGHENLESLPRDRWSIIHDLAVNAAGDSVDHLVIGPSGVFIVDAKDLPGSVRVSDRAIRHNGRRTDLLAKIRREAEDVATALANATGLPIDVRPVLALRASELDLRNRPLDVEVLLRSRLTEWLKGLPTVLFPVEVAAIEGAILDPATWRSSYGDARRSGPLQVLAVRTPGRLAQGGAWRRHGKLFL